MNLSDVAVIVAVRNEEAQIVDCVNSLLVAAKGEAELVFIDDNSADRTREILASYGSQLLILGGAVGGRDMLEM